MKNYIANALTKIDAYTIAMNVVEEKYKLTIEEIYDNIKKSANNGEFHLKYYLKYKESRILVEYFKIKGYACDNGYDVVKDDNGNVMYTQGIIAVKRHWIDIWWSIK